MQSSDRHVGRTSANQVLNRYLRRTDDVESLATLARRLAPLIGAGPGALHLRSDVVRKKLFAVEDETRLPENAYAPEVSERVYRRLGEIARVALRAGPSVIVDTVFGREDGRVAIAGIAAEAAVSFEGAWLDVPADVMRARLAMRGRDASDATVAVLEQQLKHDPGRIKWIRMPSSGSAEDVAARAAARPLP